MHSIGNEVNLRRGGVHAAVLPTTTLPVISSILISAIILSSFYWAFSPMETHGASLEVWWPQNGAHMEGTQPFKAVLQGEATDSYEMFWQVDGGVWNWMDTDSNDHPHKEARVSLRGWDWKGEGPYTVNFIARKNGSVIAQKSVEVYNDSARSSQSKKEEQKQEPKKEEATKEQQVEKKEEKPKEEEKDKPTVAATLAPKTNPVSNSSWYVNPDNSAQKQVKAWNGSRPDDAALIDIIARQPNAVWLGGWSGDIESAARKVASAAKEQGKTALFVAYNIPQRDCGGYSAGGTSYEAYSSWVKDIAEGIGNAKAAVILEPDALPGIECLSEQDQQRRYDLLSEAVATLKSNGNTAVYIDAGNPGWNNPQLMADKLTRANIAQADGFALNVSNFKSTSENTQYGTEVSKLAGGKHFVIDTSRNGQGWSGEWCNPEGRGLGQLPTSATGNPLVDAYLWIKMPGESDGTCQGGPNAGDWWADYAIGLVKRAKF